MELKDLLATTTTLAERSRTSAFIFVCFLLLGILLTLLSNDSSGQAVSGVFFLFLILFTARRLKIPRSQALLFGYVVTVKLVIMFNIGPHLALVGYNNFTNTTPFWLVIGLALVVWWTVAEAPKVTILRLFSITALAVTCWIANQWLGPFNRIDGPTDAYFWEFEARNLLGEPDYFIGELSNSLGFYFFPWAVISFFAFLVLDKGDQKGRMLAVFSHKAISSGARFGRFALLFGALAACILVGFFSANNSYIVTGIMPRDYMLLDGLPPWLDFRRTVQLPYGQSYVGAGQNRLLYHLLQFDLAALKSGLTGILKSAPFIAFGCALALIASRFRLTGLLPILAIGAFAGLGWHFAYPNYGYWTPFMTTLQSAVLIGMICAAGFGAVAQLFPARVIPSFVE